MTTCRIALANVRIPSSLEDSVALAEDAIAEAGAVGANIVCFPECFVPGYRIGVNDVARVNNETLERAWSTIADAASRSKVAVILGTERIVAGGLRITALVINADGKTVGYQDKVQLDPSEESVYSPGTDRVVFEIGELVFGIAICHEGFRYPETVRWAARRGAHVVFHPHFAEADSASFRPTVFADPQNSFHEKALLCRAAENTCYVASVNCASPGSPTTSAFIRPDGTVQCYQPYAKEGLLVADIDPTMATGMLASRLKPEHLSAQDLNVTAI